MEKKRENEKNKSAESICGEWKTNATAQTKRLSEKRERKKSEKIQIIALSYAIHTSISIATQSVNSSSGRNELLLNI